MKQFKVQITAFESLLDENLEELKGGTAEVYATEEDKKKQAMVLNGSAVLVFQLEII